MNQIHVNTSILSAQQVAKTFGSGHTRVTAVRDLNLEVAPGELVLIMGPSGSGKTTLLSMLGGLLTPSRGTISIDGTVITGLRERQLPPVRARKVGFIFQAFNLLDALTVEDNILFPARLLPGGPKSAAGRAANLMERMNLMPRRRALPGTLSGGEKQRVAIARALINQPPVILADEPTGNLDSQSGQEVMMILHDLARDEGRSVVLVTHDPRVEEIADRILWLEDGRLTDRPEQHPWSRCPVCNMRVDEWTAQFHLVHEGKRLVFCSQGCLKKFSEERAV